jgi:hypothetical protein
MNTRSFRLVSALILAGAGCVGSVESLPPAAGSNPPGNAGGGSSDPGGGSPPGGGNTGPAPTIPTDPGQSPGACRESAPQVSAARRLTRDEYSNTIRDLLGDDRGLGGRLPSDDGNDGLFVEPGTLIVTPVWAGNAMTTAEEIAKTAVAKLGTSGNLLPCPASEGETCARSFIDSFGKRAFRRPVAPAEADGLLEVWKAGANAAGGFNHGIELVLQAILQSPSFLYRLELGQQEKGSGSDSGTIKLTPYEVASRLSYGLWGTMPDETLMKAADAGQLNSADAIGAQAERMVGDPRARATMVEFVGHWFGVTGLDDVMKDPTQYPEFTEKMLGAMKTGVASFVDQLLAGGPGNAKFETLLTAPWAMVDATTAPLYGVTAPAGDKAAKIDLPGGHRFGLLTNVGILTAHTFADSSAPIHRGKFVRERLLCTDPPNPPADLMVEPPTPQAGVSTRVRLGQHTGNPACSGCHEFMDPLGFAFGHFDGLGRWRDQDQGQAIDDSGKMAFSDVDGDFTGIDGLAAKLSSSSKVKECVAGTFLRFTSGTESVIDECAQKKLQTAFAESNGDLLQLVVAITRTDAFRYRRTSPGEVSP